MEPIIGRRQVGRAFADGAYSSEQNFELCYENNVDPVIPVHINAKSGRHKEKENLLDPLNSGYKEGGKVLRVAGTVASFLRKKSVEEIRIDGRRKAATIKDH